MSKKNIYVYIINKLNKFLSHFGYFIRATIEESTGWVTTHDWSKNPNNKFRYTNIKNIKVSKLIK